MDKNALAACFGKNGIITNDRDILNHAGKISHEIAKQLAEGEYEKFHTRRLSTSKNELSDFDRAVQQIESQKKGEKHD